MTRDEKMDLIYRKGCSGIICDDCKVRDICDKHEGIDDDWTDKEIAEALNQLGIDPAAPAEKYDGYRVPDDVKTAPVEGVPVEHVNSPKHYGLPGGLEVIDVELATQGREAVMNHCICTAIEYLLRHTRKNGEEDVEKARWWLNKWHELKEE